MNHPQSTSAKVAYLPPNHGGGGLLPLDDLADAMAIDHAFIMLTTEDPMVRALARVTLSKDVELRIGRPPKNSDGRSPLREDRRRLSASLQFVSFDVVKGPQSRP